MKVTREEFDFMLGRSRGCIGRVRASAGAAPTAGARSRRPKGPPCKSPGRLRGFKLALLSECEYGLGLDRDPLGADTAATFTVEFLQYCSAVEWAGALRDDGKFSLTKEDGKDGVYTLRVKAENPDHYVTPWHANPNLQDVKVQYRMRGDWEDATTTSGNTAYLYTATDEPQNSAYYEVEMDFTNLPDADYELRVVAYCSALKDERGSTTTPNLPGLKDTEPPAIFGEFGEPADGLYSPGDSISLAFTEDIECRKPFQFGVLMKVCAKEAGSCSGPADPGFVRVIEMEELDIVCEGWVSMPESTQPVIHMTMRSVSQHTRLP